MKKKHVSKKKSVRLSKDERMFTITFYNSIRRICINSILDNFILSQPEANESLPSGITYSIDHWYDVIPDLRERIFLHREELLEKMEHMYDVKWNQICGDLVRHDLKDPISFIQANTAYHASPEALQALGLI
jgi:histone deacetylase complex regulatory component SIN3